MGSGMAYYMNCQGGATRATPTQRKGLVWRTPSRTSSAPPPSTSLAFPLVVVLSKRPVLTPSQAIRKSSLSIIVGKARFAPPSPHSSMTLIPSAFTMALVWLKSITSGSLYLASKIRMKMLCLRRHMELLCILSSNATGSLCSPFFISILSCKQHKFCQKTTITFDKNPRCLKLLTTNNQYKIKLFTIKLRTMCWLCVLGEWHWQS